MSYCSLPSIIHVSALFSPTTLSLYSPSTPCRSILPLSCCPIFRLPYNFAPTINATINAIIMPLLSHANLVLVKQLSHPPLSLTCFGAK